jgi:hypothetical protein
MGNWYWVAQVQSGNGEVDFQRVEIERERDMGNRLQSFSYISIKP